MEPSSGPPENFAGEPTQAEFDFDEGYVPPDPNEPPPVELWSSVGDVRPWGTALLLLAWAVVFLVVAARHGLEDGDALLAWGANATQRDPSDVPWRLLASTFLHAGPAHVFFNATSMLIFGPAVERVFTRWGFWIVYALGGATASLVSLLWRSGHLGAATLSIGASGAIFALGGALLVGAVRLRSQLAVGRARALGAALFYLVATGFAAGFTRNGTDNSAHTAGLLSGALLGGVLGISPRLGGASTSAATRILSMLGVAALLTALVLAFLHGLAAP